MMFTRWFNVRLKAAEKALRQGRLDDALAVVREPDLRECSRGQKLLDALVKPLMARARLHRQAGRYQDALADLDQLDVLSRGGPDVQTLRQRIGEEIRAGAQRAAEEQQEYDRATDDLRAGRLETGRLNVQRLDDTRRREELTEELDVRVQRGGQLLQQATEALERDDTLAAARFWQDACRHHGRTQDTDRFAARLAGACRRTLERWHEEGRIEGLLAARQAISGVISYDPTLADCERLIGLCTRATSQLAAANYTGLRQTLLRLKAVRSDVAWVNTTLDALARIAEGQEALMASPLGLYASDAGNAVRQARGDTFDAGQQAGRDMADTVTRPRILELPPADPNALRLDRPLLMLVDGGGSSLLIGRGQVRIGRAGTTADIDVPIPAEIESHHADITRRGEDYFLTAYGPAQVNQRPVEHTLLRDGDRIVLGTSAKMTFHKPSAKSESAVLRLSHRCRLPQDVSNVVLFRDTCLIGSGKTCHVRTHEDNGQIVLFERGGGLYARQTGGNGHLTAPVRAVIGGETLEFGNLRVTVKPYTASRSKGSI
ncbi:MAG: FHA domain-containing protein [Phycisphaerae bacterium]|nr:FHA domain-containing protein [Phycisphaerae bacterium]